MDLPKPEGEFHHYQIVDPEGNIPFSISVLVHYNSLGKNKIHLEPITASDAIQFHNSLKKFDGDFMKSFKQNDK